MTNSMTTDPLGTEGMDIEHSVETSRITAKSPNASETPLKRAINIHATTINKLVPFVFKLTPIVNTKFDTRESLFILLFMQCSVVGSVTALKVEISSICKLLLYDKICEILTMK